MGKSILTRNAAAFEAANVAKGITPSRDIRQERKDAESLKWKRTLARKEYEKRKEEEFVKEHGISSSEHRKNQRETDWVEFVGEEPILDDDDMDWSEELKVARAKLKRHGEEEGLPEKPSKFFSYWMRHELLYMRGSGSQRLHPRDWSYVDYMEDIRIHEGRWQYSVIVYVRPEHIDASYDHLIDFLALFDQERLSGNRIRIWFPFGVVSTERFQKLAGIYRNCFLAFQLIKRNSHKETVVAFFNLHHLGTVKNSTTFTNLHRRFVALTFRDKKEKEVVDKLAKLNSLWK